MNRKRPSKYEIGPGKIIELSSEDTALFEKKTNEAEQDIEAARVNFRWDKEHVDLIKTVAGIIGVPYQTYMKMVLFEHAIECLQKYAQIPTEGKTAPHKGNVGNVGKTLRKRKPA